MITISPRLVKRFLSAAAIAPMFLFLLVFSTWTFWGVLTFAFAIAAQEWVGLVRVAPAAHKLIIAALGLVYLPISFYAFSDLRFTTFWESDSLGKTVVVLLVLMVWASDTGGYVVGKLLKGPKLIPSISPNKTWAGLGGAVLFPLLILAPFGVMNDGWSALSVYNCIWCLVVSILTGLAGQAGDLMISAVKRIVGVKDTGTIIPGHGGLLDRIDALMMASVLMFILAHSSIF